MATKEDNRFLNFDFESFDDGEGIPEGLAGHIMTNHEEIISGIDDKKRPIICNKLARILARESDTMGDGSSERDAIEKVVLLITRRGLNQINVGMSMDMAPDFEMAAVCAELFYLNSDALMKLNRPFAALEMLEYSERMLERCKLMNVDNPIASALIEYNYEISRLKETYVWMDIFRELDDESKQDMAVSIGSYLVQSAEIIEMFDDEAAMAALVKYKLFEQGPARDVPMRDQSYFDDAEIRDADESDYVEWCWNRHLILNPMNEVPNIKREWMKDILPSSDNSTMNVRLSDIFSTYDHCRRILHRYEMIPEDDRMRKHRDEDVESLIDCYYRLFSIFDKLSKVMGPMLDLPFQDLYFKDMADHFEDSPNRYLRGIYEIKADMNYSNEEIHSGYLDPFYAIHGVKKRPNTIRNTMAHSAVLVLSPDEEFTIHRNIVTMRPWDLENEVMKLMLQAREVMLNFTLAISYNRGHDDKESE